MAVPEAAVKRGSFALAALSTRPQGHRLATGSHENGRNLGARGVGVAERENISRASLGLDVRPDHQRRQDIRALQDEVMPDKSLGRNIETRASLRYLPHLDRRQIQNGAIVLDTRR